MNKLIALSAILFILSSVEGYAAEAPKAAAAAPAPAPKVEEKKAAPAPKAEEKMDETNPGAAPTTVKWTSQQATKKAFGKAVEAYITAEAAKTGGVFTLKDAEGNDQQLVLIRIHKHRIESQGGDNYSAAGDFKSAASEKVKARVEFSAIKMGDAFVVNGAEIKSITGGEPKPAK